MNDLQKRSYFINLTSETGFFTEYILPLEGNIAETLLSFLCKLELPEIAVKDKKFYFNEVYALSSSLKIISSTRRLGSLKNEILDFIVIGKGLILIDEKAYPKLTASQIKLLTKIPHVKIPVKTGSSVTLLRRMSVLRACIKQEEVKEVSILSDYLEKQDFESKGDDSQTSLSSISTTLMKHSKNITVDFVKTTFQEFKQSFSWEKLNNLLITLDMVIDFRHHLLLPSPDSPSVNIRIVFPAEKQGDNKGFLVHNILRHYIIHNLIKDQSYQCNLFGGKKLNDYIRNQFRHYNKLNSCLIYIPDSAIYGVGKSTDKDRSLALASSSFLQVYNKADIDLLTSTSVVCPLCKQDHAIQHCSNF
jgi:hypothetical protein